VRLAVVGGKLQGTEACYLGLKAGFETVLIDRCDRRPAAGLAAETHIFDVTVEQAAARDVLASCDAVLPACEDDAALDWLARVVPQLGVPLLFDLAAYRVTSSKSASNDLIRELGVPAYAIRQLRDVFIFKKPDAIVDFSSPEQTMELVELCIEHGINIIIGTTGFQLAQLTRLKEYSLRSGIAILYAPNITLGVNVLLAMAQLAAKYLDGYDFNITEIHYKGKKDAPSGTAGVIARTLHNGVMESCGHDVAIPINSIRAGGYIGRHEILAVGENDKIEIVHESFTRKAFADGALLAVRSVGGRKGWLEMKDVIRM
jgi:4-hydroxy-tetrahydrodipicolinate reductase